MTAAAIYGLVGVLLVAIGLYRLVTTGDLLRRVVALNVAATGAGAVLMAAAYRAPPAPTDPTPHALVITGIVVVVSTTAVALALIRRLHDEDASDDRPAA